MYFTEDLYSDTEDEDRLLIVEESEKEDKTVKTVSVNNIDHSNNMENGCAMEPINHNNNDVLISTRVKSMHDDKKDMIIWMHNTRLRHDLYKEIKKPGRSKYYKSQNKVDEGIGLSK